MVRLTGRIEGTGSLEGCKSSGRLTQGILHILGPAQFLVSGVLVTMAEGLQELPHFLVVFFFFFYDYTKELEEGSPD